MPQQTYSDRLRNESSHLIAILSDSVAGGAAIAANRLTTGLSGIGQPVSRWHFTPVELGLPGVHEVRLDVGAKRPPLERIIKNFHKGIARKLREIRHENALLELLRDWPPRVLHLHNIHGCGLTHRLLARLPKSIPIVWTMHDEWAFRPAAYTWRDSGGKQGQAGVDSHPDEEARRSRAEFFAARPDVVLVGPSRWLVAEASSFVPPTTRVEYIPYGIPLCDYAPGPKREAREALRLDRDAIIIGFGAAGFDERKGGDILLAALAEVKLENAILLVWGDDEHWKWPSTIRVHRVGFIKQTARLRQLYSACDLFVCPSRIDNLPNTIIESLACGTPVVASGVGGIPDLVREGETGWLYPHNSPSECAQAIRRAISDYGQWTHYRDRARAFVEQCLPEPLQARRYLSLYNEIVAYPRCYKPS